MFPDHLRLSATPFLKILSAHNSRLTAALLTLTIAAMLAVAGRAPFIRSAAAAMFADNDFAPVTVSAASYETTAIAPDSIVAAFGTKLATGTFVAEDADQATAGLQLPTTLGGTTVRINGQAAGLFFVSPSQVNYVIPSNVASGTATVQITSGDGTVSTGTVQLAQVAPGIFSGNADGEGVPAAYLVRVKADNSVSYESVSQLVNGRLVTRPIDLGPEGEHVFLVLFASGLSHASDPNSDNNFSENVRVVLGGTEVTPSFAGRQGYFVGLDQINVEIPRNLIGRGKVSLSVAATGYSASKLSEIEIASPAGTTPPQVTGFSSSSVLAGQTLTINGSGFSTEATDNTVRISGSEATVTSASSSQLTVQVPYGAQSGMVSVRTPQGEGTGSSALALRTSISGFIEDTNRQPMSGVTVKVAGTSTQVTTNSEGLFVLPDVASGAALVEIDAQNVTSPPFPKVTLKIPVTASRDNQFSRPVSLQQATGASLPVGSGGSNQPQSVSVALPPERHSGRYRPSGTITSGSVTFDLPAGTATFPDGASSGTIYLTLLDNSRTPVDLPGGHFSTAIVQLSPFGVTLSPGGKLSFPNPENWAAGSEGTLFRFEQNLNSASVGRFVEAGTAQVSSDGQRIETADGAITTTGIYFVSRLRQTTTVTGRVLDSDGKTPVRNALVRTRGQETFTDGNGGFIVRSVPVKAGETISVEASFLRPNGRVDRKQSADVPVVVGGITNITPDIVLPAPALNRPPVIQAPATFTVSEGQNVDLRIAAFDPDEGQTITLSLMGPGFASLIEGTEKLVRLTPGFSDAGTYTLTLTAKDNLNAMTTRTIALTVSNTNRPPTSSGQSLTTSEDTALNITLSGSDPDGDTITFIPLLAPAHGTISGTAPNLTYTPASNYNGTDSFSFKVSDGRLESPVYTISFTISAVNDAPVADGQSVTTAEDTPKAIPLTGSDVDGDTLTFTVVSGPAKGTLSGTAPNLTYTPNANYNGSDSFTFRVSDGAASSNVATVSINVTPVNDPPVANGQSVTTAEDTAKAITLTGSDVEGSALNWIIVTSPAKGTLSGTAPNLTYTPNANYNGADSFTFKVNDGQADSAVATVSINVTAVNDPPVAIQQTLSVNEDTPINITLTGSDVEGSALTFTVVTGPANGTLSGTAPNLTYTPNPNFNGTDSFTFKVNDGQADSAPATITLNVQAVNDAPAISVPGQQTVITEDLLSFTISGSDVDAGQTLTFSAMNLPPGANFDPATKTFTWTPAWNQVGTFDVDFKVQDNGAPPQSKVGQVRIIVNPVLNWTQNADGPNGGEIFALVGDPSMLLAGTYEGIFKSTDGGAFWLRSNGNLPPGGAVNSFAGSPSNGFISRHGTGPNDGVWRTTDGGATWTQASNGLPAVFINALLMNGTTLFAATENGLFRSTDNGANWSQSNSGLQSLRVLSLGAVGTNLYAGTDQGISLSNDDGATWTSLNAGLPQAPLNIPAMITTGSRLFAAVNESVYELSADGQSWLDNGFGLPRSSQVYALTINGSELFAGTLGYGIYKTRIDTEPYFVPASNGLRNMVISALMPVGPELYAGTFGGGVWKSTDGGQNWTSATAGIRQSRPRCFAQIGSTLFAGTQGNGLFKTTDNGITWNPASGNLPGWEITALAADGTDLYAGTWGDGLWLSRDNGTTWNQIEIEYTYGGPITSIVVSGSEIYVSTPNGIIKSPVGNYSFTLVINGLTSVDVRALAAPGTELYAATADGIFRSIDRGLTWSQVGSAATGLTSLDVRSLATDTTNIYAGTAGGIFKMPLAVGNWAAINTGVTNLNINQVTAYSGKLFAATDGGVFFSTDGGAKWKNGSYNLYNQNVKALFVSGAKVFAGTDGSAAWSSSY
jgi:uncharacterized protein (TIGR03437 family)